MPPISFKPFFIFCAFLPTLSRCLIFEISSLLFKMLSGAFNSYTALIVKTIINPRDIFTIIFSITISISSIASWFRLRGFSRWRLEP